MEMAHPTLLPLLGFQDTFLFCFMYDNQPANPYLIQSIQETYLNLLGQKHQTLISHPGNTSDPSKSELMCIQTR